MGNFLRDKLLEEDPLRKKVRQDRNKVKYMESLGDYFQSSKNFIVAFATLATNIDFSQKLLEQFPTAQIKLVSGKMIEDKIQLKAL
ncbi:hypothetical protein [Planococcus halotolerans]|uniref:hypothetical protein n=1 Tax=Planococcus halotolerans TaxID=2233542 RepID=UPI0010918D07|nr:hypothetical protein [Planococcus halotolerans]QHJ70561.1 hypothetical protein DNR44_008060 [Planococcus halotolerans]